MLGHHGDGDLRVVDRRETDEQGVIPQELGDILIVEVFDFFALLRPLEHLGRTGLPGQRDRHVCGDGARGAPGADDDGLQAVDHGLPIGPIVLDHLDRVCAADQPRRRRAAAAGQRCGHRRQLQRRDHGEALADAGDDRLSGKPRFVQVPALPAAPREHPGVFIAQIDPGRLAESEEGQLARDRIDAEIVRQLIEIDVDRLLQRRAQIDPTVPAVAPVPVVA
jgi:hypothetical protein